MLMEEARWFGQRIAEMDPASVFPLCNVGSSTERFRRVDQPWIDRHIFGPMRDAGRPVTHLDMKAADGVDLVGDLGDPAFAARVRGMGFQSVFCSNLLEHVVDRAAVCSILLDLVQPGGLLFISVPYQYPEHHDPIDTLFRPDLDELAAEFAGTERVTGEIVVDARILRYLARSPAQLASNALPLLAPFYRPRAWWLRVKHWGWALRRAQASCIVLRKAT